MERTRDRHFPSLSTVASFLLPFLIPRTTKLRVMGLISITSTFLQKCTNLLPPIATKVLVDALVAPESELSPADKMRRAGWAAVAFFIARQAAVGFGVMKDISFEQISQSILRRFATETFRIIQLHSYGYHTERSAGVHSAVLGRGTGAVATLTNIVCLELAPTLVEALLVTAAFARMGAPKIAATTAISVGAYIWFTASMTRRRVLLNRRVVDANNTVSRHTVETLSQAETVKAFGMERREGERSRTQRGAVRAASNQTKWMVSSIGASQAMIMHCGIAVGSALAAWDAASGRMTAGDYVLAHAFIAQLFAPLQWLGRSYGTVVDAVAYVEEVMVVHRAERGVRDAPEAAPLARDAAREARGVYGSVEFRDVSFRYRGVDGVGGGGLRGVSFVVPGGTTTALVGASGSGKTTVLRLLLRLYDVDTGSILVDGQDIRAYTQASLRRAMAVVGQEPGLFSDTIRRNVAYGAPEASDGAVWGALARVGMDGAVRERAGGLQGLAGALSGGERQRLGAARAALPPAALLLLDEPAAAQDAAGARALTQALRKLARGRTTLVVSHRLVDIAHASQILVFARGEIVERGTHGELVGRADGVYARLWKLQNCPDEKAS